MKRLAFLLAFVCAVSLVSAEQKLKLRAIPPAAGGSGVTCAQLGVTCVRETSFTSAQGWSSPPYTQQGDGVPDCATFPGSTGSFAGIQTGISNAGGWDAGGYCDQVTTAANWSGGAGGSGFRHRRGNGQNSNGGGITITLPSAVPHVWVRMYMRYQSGFSWAGGSPAYTKDHYWGGCGSGCIIFGHQGGAWGINYNGGDNIPSSRTWTQTMGGATGDGLWHKYEYEIFKNGASGIVRLKVDGVQYLDTTWDLGSGTLSDMILGENQHDVTGASPPWATDYDDLAFSTTGWIGGTNP